MLYAFNIGLNVRGTEPQTQLAQVLRFAGTLFGFIPRAVAMGVGEGEGERERFIQIAAEAEQPELAARLLARALNQTVVAMIDLAARENWVLVYAGGRTEPGFDTAAMPIIVTL